MRNLSNFFYVYEDQIFILKKEELFHENLRALMVVCIIFGAFMAMYDKYRLNYIRKINKMIYFI